MLNVTAIRFSKNNMKAKMMMFTVYSFIFMTEISKLGGGKQDYKKIKWVEKHKWLMGFDFEICECAMRGHEKLNQLYI